MKNFIGSILMCIALALAVGFVGGYEDNIITYVQLLIYEAFASALGYLGYKMLDIKEG